MNEESRGCTRGLGVMDVGAWGMKEGGRGQNVGGWRLGIKTAGLEQKVGVEGK